MKLKMKAKTHKGMAKRLKVTATGKVVRRKGGKSHLLSNKPGRRLQKLRRSVTLANHVAKKIKEQMTS